MQHLSLFVNATPFYPKGDSPKGENKENQSIQTTGSSQVQTIANNTIFIQPGKQGADSSCPIISDKIRRQIELDKIRRQIEKEAKSTQGDQHVTQQLLFSPNKNTYWVTVDEMWKEIRKQTKHTNPEEKASLVEHVADRIELELGNKKKAMQAANEHWYILQQYGGDHTALPVELALERLEEAVQKCKEHF